MLPLQFIATDAHFIIAVAAAAACFATYWLYFDAWITDRNLKGFLKWLGFGLLALGFSATSLNIEASFLGDAAFNQTPLISLLLKGAGYLSLIVSLAIDRLQPLPDVKPLYQDLMTQASWTTPGPAAPPKPKKPGFAVPTAAVILGVLGAAGLNYRSLPLLAAIICFMYWRQALQGLERHLKPVGWVFVAVTLYELADLARFFRDTDDPRLYNLFAAFGPVWLLNHLFLLASALLLGRWVWQYLTKRIQTQLFMVLTAACLVIFLVTTASFTTLLMNRVQTQATANLITTSKTLDFAVQSKLAETASTAEIVAHDPVVITAVTSQNHPQLTGALSDTLRAKKLSSLIITTESGKVLLRAEDPARWGDSLSDDPFVIHALVGKATTGLVSANDNPSGRLIMRGATPIRNANGLIIGTVTSGLTVDNAFVDGLQHATGLAASVYSGSDCVATTLLNPDGQHRATGIRETNTAVTHRVLSQNQSWSGFTGITGTTYLAVYTPLVDPDNVPVGMIFLGLPQTSLLQLTSHAIQITFIITIALLLVAIVPLNLVARYLAKQLR